MCNLSFVDLPQYQYTQFFLNIFRETPFLNFMRVCIKNKGPAITFTTTRMITSMKEKGNMIDNRESY